MKFQVLLISLSCLLLSSGAVKVNNTSSATRETRTPKITTIFHNGRPVEVLTIPQQRAPPLQLQQIQPIQLASNVAPTHVKGGQKIALNRDKVLIKNEKNYLQDSYGNRFYGLPQHEEYKFSYPQELVAVQDLPAHFAQPLLGPTRTHAAYSLPQFSFSEASNRVPIFHGDGGFFNYANAAQSLPVVLPPQHLNVPIQSHYKIGDSSPVIIGKPNGGGPVEYSFNSAPEQYFQSFPSEHLNQQSFSQVHNTSPGRTQSQNNNQKPQQNKQQNNKIASQKLQEQNNQKRHRTPENRNKPVKQQQLKKQHPRPIVVQNPTTIDPQYYQPQIFAEPIVPQVQHFLPKIQNVLKYSIDPKPDVPIVSDPESIYSDAPFQQQVQELLSRPQKNNRIIIKEYNQPEKHEHKEEVKAEVTDEEENEENNFNEGYEAAAEGFPASSNEEDFEKHIYNDDSYGEPQYHDTYSPSSEELDSSGQVNPHSKYVISSSLQHNSYGDDGVNEFKPIPYYEFSELAAQEQKKLPPKKTTSHSNRHKKPQKIVKSEYHEQNLPYQFSTQNFNSNNKRKSPQKSARYEVDYAKGYPRQSQQSEQYRRSELSKAPERTKFIEPQYQYGFEPIIESKQSEEPASSASNVVTESEAKPNSMKKVYKENWYISKTSSSEAEMDT